MSEKFEYPEIRITGRTPAVLSEGQAGYLPVSQWPDRFTQGHLVGCLKSYGPLVKRAADFEPPMFQLYDDDGNLYFQGLYYGSDDFGPLTDFGVSYGCTTLKYWERGAWRVL